MGYSLKEPGNNLIYSIIQNINIGNNSDVNKEYNNLETTSNSFGQNAKLKITTDINGYCKNVTVVNKGEQYQIGDNLIVSKNLLNSNTDLIFKLHENDPEYSDVKKNIKASGLSFTCKGNDKIIHYGKCSQEEYKTKDNCDKANWIPANLFSKDCKGWYELKCYNGTEVISNQKTCEDNEGTWSEGICTKEVEKDQDKCNGYMEQWKTFM